MINMFDACEHSALIFWINKHFCLLSSSIAQICLWTWFDSSVGTCIDVFGQVGMLSNQVFQNVTNVMG